MPLTDFQIQISQLLAQNHTEQDYLAGGAALHLAPNSQRYSNDLDYFCDSEARVAKAFSLDRFLLEKNDYHVSIEISQPGYIRTIVSKEQKTKIEWAHDSAWRFMPTQVHPTVGYCLHPVDLAINKLLALVGRDEPRDFLDTLYTHDTILPLGAMCWAACGKDPGFTPQSILALLKRRGRYQVKDFERLRLVTPVDLPELKTVWLQALVHAEFFIESQPPNELGCLYFSKAKGDFVAPSADRTDIVPHFGRPGGVLPNILPD